MYAPVCSRFRTYGVETPRIVSGYIERMFVLPAMQDWLAEARQEVANGLPGGPLWSPKK
jgi:glutathione S-transferase